MSMFCYQCQEAAKGTGCTIQGVCGKNEDVARSQDLLIWKVKSIGEIVYKNNIKSENLKDVNYSVLNSLFMTITNANFDKKSIEKQIALMSNIEEELLKHNQVDSLNISEDQVGVLSTENEDIRSLRELITYGLKGMAAYLEHAFNLGFEDFQLYDFIYKALSKSLDDNLTAEDLLELVLETGEKGVQAMALLDKANTNSYGNPEITNVNIGVKNKPGILISGHDLNDLEQLLEQTQGTGVDVYTHSEMLPAHYYPKFKKYENFIGNYGNAWWKQKEEFASFNGPILFTTNCIVPPADEEIRSRIWTTGSSGYPGCQHISPDSNGRKDFTEIIQMAKTKAAPTEIETGSIVGGFAHSQVFELADEIVDAIKSGAIRKFFVMAGCDGRMKSRDYYTEFAKNLPEDTIILTAGCAKYRYNKLDLGEINGIPRVLDAGQCNDSYSLALIALKLKEIFELEDINELPIVYNIAWYEQKAVIVLLALLHLGIKDIHLGPTLPAFLSENIVQILVEEFGISGIGSVDSDISKFLG